MTRPVSGSGSWKITNAATISVTMEATVDIAPTQTTSMPDLTADPLVIACRTWTSPHAIATIQNVIFKLFNSPVSLTSACQSSGGNVSVPSMKRVLPRNADRRFEKAFLRAVSGGRVRRHGGLNGARARSGQGDAANQSRYVSANRASPFQSLSSQGLDALT